MKDLHDLVFNHIRSGVVVIDPLHHEIVEINPAAAEMIGLPRGEIIGKVCHKFICPALSGKCPITDLGQEVDDSERVLINGKGDRIPILKSVIPVKLNDRELLIENFIDIRELKSAEERFHLFLDYTYNWEYFMDRDGNIPYSSPSSLRVTGYSMDEILKNPELVTGMILPEDQPLFNQHRNQSPDPAVLHDVECRIQTKKGHKRWIRHFCQPVFNAEGEYLGLRASNIDIDKRKHAEIRLQKSEALLRSVYETAGVGMVLLDPLGNFLKVNPSFCRMLGYTEEELLSGDHSITHPDDVQQSEEVLQQLREGAITTNVMEKRYLKKDGTVIQVMHHVSIIHDLLGFQYLFVVQAHDITALKEATRKAEESDELKTSFLHNLSHEIRTPANAIQGFSELLKQPDLTLEEKEEFIAIIHQSVRQLIDILNDTVEISKLETNQVSIVNASFDLNRLMQQIYRDCSNKYAHAVSQLEDFYLELPSGISTTLHTDELRVGQILMCLLSNAFKFTTSGRVSFGYLTFPDQIHFFVKDTGIGISPEKQSVIFEKFRQGETSTTRIYGGLGIGLTIARGLTQAIGGKIWLNSAEGEGSTFYFSVPITTEGRDLSERADTRPKASSKFDFTGKTILIAEDIDANFDYLKIALFRTHATVFRAVSGVEAIRMCRENPSVDLVMMDIQMPEMNGYDATRGIKAFRPDLPVVAQTAYSIDFNQEDAFAAGCDAYLTKPIGLQELFQTLERFLLPVKK